MIAVMSNTITVCDPFVRRQLARQRRRCQRIVLTRLQGEIYEKIIQEVINASQNDFEENGVQQQTLVELQQVGHLFSLHSPYLSLSLSCFLLYYLLAPNIVLLFRCKSVHSFVRVAAAYGAEAQATSKKERRKRGLRLRDVLSLTPVLYCLV